MKAGGTYNEESIDGTTIHLANQIDKYPLVKLRISLAYPDTYISIFMFANLKFTSGPSRIDAMGLRGRSCVWG